MLAASAHPSVLVVSPMTIATSGCSLRRIAAARDRTAAVWMAGVSEPISRK